MYSTRTRTHTHTRAVNIVLACAHIAILAVVGTYFTPAIIVAVREVVR